MKLQLILWLGLVVVCIGCGKSERAPNMQPPRDRAQEVTAQKNEAPIDTPRGAINLEPPIQPRSLNVAPEHPEEPVAAMSEKVAAEETGRNSHPQSTAEDNGDAFAVVEVFYGTDRATGVEFPVFELITVMVLAFLVACFLFLAARSHRAVHLGLSGVCLVATIWFANSAIPKLGATKINKGVVYGNERGKLMVGTCEVTIPKNHVRGELESPSLLRFEFHEDQSKHLVLADANQLTDDKFFRQLQQVVSESGREELLVFVHGYNVSFEDAARRTAQIAYDLNFPGAPVFFSWPSQGGLFEYTIDETNVEWCVPDLKRFLLDLRHKSGARAINLIAHSMGNRAITSALHDLALESKQGGILFNEVVLAAPDIDAEVFRRRIAPVITQTANHVTMYASANDQALLASKQIHGYPRAGNSADGVVVVPGIETVDVSEIDTSLLGHGYVGDCEKVLSDIHEMIHESLRAPQRRLLRPMLQDQMTWWTFQRKHATTAASPTTVR